MSIFLTDHLDFICLIYGVTFFVLALIAGSLVRRHESFTDWRYLCGFGILHGVGIWSEMLIPLWGGSRWFSILHGTVVSLSFLCLFEFGRRTFIWLKKWKTGGWIYLPALVLIGMGLYANPVDFPALSRFYLGLPAGLLAALALRQIAAQRRVEVRVRFTYFGALALVFYSFSAGGIVPQAHFWPASHFHETWFYATTGVPVQVVRCLLAILLILALWPDYVRWKGTHYAADFARRVRIVRSIAVISVVLVVIAGWFLVERAELECREDHEWRLLSLARGMAASISFREVGGLSGGRSDMESQAFSNLRHQCQRICDADPSIRNVYLLGRRAGQVVFLLDVEPTRFNVVVNRQNAVPGDRFMRLSPALDYVFEKGQAVVSAPYFDPWGRYITGYAPVVEPTTGAVVAVMGIDEPWGEWAADIRFARLLRLFLTGGAILLLLLFTVLWQREIEESQIRNATGQRIQRQQLTLLRISNSSFVSDGNVFMMARSVTAMMADVLDVERVELWLREADEFKFRAEDIFRAGVGTHASGKFSGVSEGDPFVKLLEEGRVAPTSNFQEDERFEGIRSEFGTEVCALVVAPLRVSGRLVGWLAAIQTSRCRNWLTDEMRFVSEMADQVAHTLINHERRLAEEALIKAHAELETRVRERTEALSLKNDELLREIKERLRIEEEQRVLQDKMQQAQKLESLGLMAGGIAHDFNNILMAILGNVELARLETPQHTPLYDYLEDIEKASCRAADLARQMLIYSGRGQVSIHGIDLNDLVAEMTSMLKVSLGKKIQLTYQLEPGLPLVDGDLTQMRQILMNLVINASEAIGQEIGSITLRTGVTHYSKAMFDEMWLRAELPDGKYVFLDVIDTGCGMDEVTVKRIFDPFFTTKFTGRGLGLAAVLGIIKGHRGTIDVTSHRGDGTRFRIILPLGKRPPATGTAHPVVERPGWTGTGTILLADDEITVRTLGRRMLERTGFTVLEAGDGREAVDLFAEHQSSIRCVLLDLTMPVLDGKEAMAAIRKRDPNAKVILCSGYMVENLVEKLADLNVSGFLQKPFKLETLVTVLQKALNS